MINYLFVYLIIYLFILLGWVKIHYIQDKNNIEKTSINK